MITKVIKSWKIDIQNGELYTASIIDNNTVVLTFGRFSHGSGYKSVLWQEFLDGEMNELIAKTMGGKVLSEILHELRLIT